MFEETPVGLTSFALDRPWAADGKFFAADAWKMGDNLQVKLQHSSVFGFGIHNTEDAQGWRAKVHAPNNPSIADLNPVAQEQDGIPQCSSSLKLKSQGYSNQLKVKTFRKILKHW